MRAVAIAVAAALTISVANGAPRTGDDPRGLTTALGAEDAGVVDRAVAAITAPSAPASADLLFAAARACEDRLGDPGRAAAIYERILARYPDARVTTQSARRLAELRPLIGAHGETAALASELAQLTAHADTFDPADVLARGLRLAGAAWPGAPAAALWLADWLRRTGRLVEAQVGYARVAARWPDSPQAREAQRGAVSCALDAQDWPRASRLAERLPATAPADRAVRDDLRHAAARGQRRARASSASWLVLAIALAALLASLVEAALRSPRGARRAALRPPVEIVFLAPVAAVLVGVALTAHRLIAPAVATISLGGLAVAYLSGATLDQLRRHGRRARLRSVVHVALCLASVVALAYLAISRDNLLDALIETVRFGPET